MSVTGNSNIVVLSISIPGKEALAMTGEDIEALGRESFQKVIRELRNMPESGMGNFRFVLFLSGNVEFTHDGEVILSDEIH